MLMWCNECRRSTRSKVLDTRASSVKIWRRRECLECATRFTTIEIPQNVPVPKPPSLAKIRQMRADRMTYKDIAERLGTSLNKVWRLDNGI